MKLSKPAACDLFTPYDKFQQVYDVQTESTDSFFHAILIYED